MMKQLISILLLALISYTASAQSDSAAQHLPMKMKMNAGIVTSKLTASKDFYTKVLGFSVAIETDFYLLMQAPGGDVFSFLLPNHPSQQALFHKPFQKQGLYLTIEVEDVDKLYKEIKKKGIPIKIELRNEPWGDRHFAIEDPNGIGIDLVTNKG